MSIEVPRLQVTVTGPFWQLWARTITGVNLDEHCMKSLEGVNAPRLGQRTPIGTSHYRSFPEVPKPLAYYVCGVSVKNVLSRNFHLLLIPDETGYEEREWEWGKCSVTGARAVPITPEHIDRNHPKAHLPVYSSCRNWQAAWWISERYGLRPPPARLF